MKPVAIFRHALTEGPGYFATYLDAHNIPWQLFKIDADDAVPKTPAAFSGLVFMGGPMSVNDELPWILPVLNLIRAGVEADVPVLGHCLGGQLMSKALGGRVKINPVKEIGWGEVTLQNTPLAHEWFDVNAGSPASSPQNAGFMSFHWHGETFSIPPGAERLLSSKYCENQAFALGKHLGMQCHIEMTHDIITTWCQNGVAEIQASNSPAVQSVADIQAGEPAFLSKLSRVADHVYSKWIQGLKR